MGKDKQDKLQRKVKKEDSEHQQITAQVKSLLNDAKSALDQGDYTKASELLQKGFELDPNSREVLRLMANVYKKTGDYQGEIGAYTQWASNNPQTRHSISYLQKHIGDRETMTLQTRVTAVGTDEWR
jgi:uncharacterized protein HemY